MKRKGFVAAALSIVLSCSMTLGNVVWAESLEDPAKEMNQEVGVIEDIPDDAQITNPEVNEADQAEQEQTDAEQTEEVPTGDGANSTTEPALEPAAEPEETEQAVTEEAKPAVTEETENGGLQSNAAADGEEEISGEISAIVFGSLDHADNIMPTGNTASRAVSDYAVIQYMASQINTAAKGGKSRVEINVASYGIARARAGEVAQEMLNSCPQLFYLQTEYSCTLNASGSNVKSYIFYMNTVIYRANGATISTQTAISQYESAVDQIVGRVGSNWSSLEKALYVNDTLATCAQYDYSFTFYDAYHILVDGVGVCQGYALAATALLNQLNVGVSYASSDSMNHIWNVVQLNGSWYHMDITWDDPSNDLPGRAGHKYFLLSDNRFRTLDHVGWVSPYTCSDTTYDTDMWNFWSGIENPFVHAGGKIFGTDQTVIQEYVLSGRNGKHILVKGSGSYNVPDMLGNWKGCYGMGYTGLGAYDNNVYFNSANGLYKLNPSTMTATKLNNDSLLNSNLGKGELYGMFMVDNHIYYNVAVSGWNYIAFYQPYSVAATVQSAVSKLKAGWNKINGKWKYGDASGRAVTGWKKISNKWYHFDGSGFMQIGWQKISNKWYYFSGSQSDGSMKIGWQKIKNKWYYFSNTQNDGSMKIGWQKIKNKWYYFSNTQNDGSMKIGWQKIKNKWYYLSNSQNDGSMAASRWVGRYYVNGSGVWTRTR